MEDKDGMLAGIEVDTSPEVEYDKFGICKIATILFNLREKYERIARDNAVNGKRISSSEFKNLKIGRLED